MPSTPKIFVLKSREIIYTLILIFLTVLLLLFMILMFTGPKKETQPARFTPGIYTSAVRLGGNSVNVEVTVDQTSIQGIQLSNLGEAVTASFPLITPSFDHLKEQILTKQSLEQITCSQENRYTSQLLFSAIEDALKLAEQWG